MAKTASKTTKRKPLAVEPHRSSRAGRTGVTVYLKPDAMKELRLIGVEENATLQVMMIQATNLFFKSRGKAAVAS